MRALYPRLPADSDTAAAASVSDADLQRLYAFPADRPWVRANFVSTLDGAAQGTDYKSGTLSGEADRHVFSLLRSLCDIVIAGAGTTRVEGYKPVRPEEAQADVRSANGLAALPAIAVVSQSLKLDPELVQGGGSPTIVITTEEAPPESLAAIRQVAPVIVAGDRRVDFDDALRQLADMGYRRMLCEGGPTLMHALVQAGRIDDLCMTISPLLTAGDRLRIVNGPALEPARHMTLQHLLEDDGTLFARYATA